MSDSFRLKCSGAPAQLIGALVDAIPYPVIVRDLDYRVVLANEAAGESYGADLLQCRCYEAVGMKDCLCSDCPARDAARTGKPVEREVRHPVTGQYLVIGVYPMYDERGELCGIIQTARDVTEARQSMEKIRALLAQVNSRNQALNQWRRSFQYELNAAREIQMRLVPTRPICVGRVCFDFLYRPSGVVGGDLYDVCPLDGGRAGLLVSDASGHGVSAGLIAVVVKMVFRSLTLDRGSPAAVLKALNRELASVVPPDQFATAFYGVFDWGARTLRYASAGHPVPLLLRGRAEGAELLAEGGLVLGTVADLPVEEQDAPFAPGDRLLLYTDGVLDAPNGRGEMFGLDRLRQVAVQNRGARGRQLLDEIMRQVAEFTGGAAGSDDITLVLAESVAGEPAEEYWLESGTHP